jgi:CHAD domain-containing protein
MRKHFAVFIANEPGTRLGEDIEALHDMRVAARRLRAAMGAFRPYIAPSWERLRQQLGWVAAALGEVRDLDVQIERMSEWRADSDEAASHALDGVEALLVARRAVARRRMLFALNSRRYEGMVTRMAAALRRGPPNRPIEGRQPVVEIAPLVIGKRYRRLRKMGDLIAPGSPPEAYHLLRIDGKKLRYACEFFGPIYGERITGFARRVTALQDVLGLHQDAEVAVTMLHEMALKSGRRLGPPTLLVMGAISERYRRHAIELRAGFPAAYRPLKKEWPPLERDLASLAKRSNAAARR